MQQYIKSRDPKSGWRKPIAFTLFNIYLGHLIRRKNGVKAILDSLAETVMPDAKEPSREPLSMSASCKSSRRAVGLTNVQVTEMDAKTSAYRDFEGIKKAGLVSSSWLSRWTCSNDAAQSRSASAQDLDPWPGARTIL